MVLGAVGQAVKQQVDAQQEEAPGGARVVGTRRRLLALLARVQGEDGDAERHGRDDEVLVQRIPPAEHGDVQEHDGEQLAALGEEEGDVVEVREGGVPKGAGEAAREGDEGEGGEDAARGDHGGDRAVARRRGVEVDGAHDGGEDGLDGVEEDGEVPDLGRIGRAVGRRRELLLEVGPRQAFGRGLSLLGFSRHDVAGQ